MGQYLGSGGGAQPQPARSATSPQAIRQWFDRYDNIRRQAQMNPADRKRADEVMSKGLAVIIPGDDKTAAQAFMRKLIQKDGAGAEQLKQLPLYPETENLHRGYYRYFTQAAKLFDDYITVQNNVFASDANGQPLAAGLPARKAALEELDNSNKALDAQLRQRFNIPAYSYIPPN
jgi:hypothetical protein